LVPFAVAQIEANQRLIVKYVILFLTFGHHSTPSFLSTWP